MAVTMPIEVGSILKFYTTPYNYGSRDWYFEIWLSITAIDTTNNCFDLDIKVYSTNANPSSSTASLPGQVNSVFIDDVYIGQGSYKSQMKKGTLMYNTTYSISNADTSTTHTISVDGSVYYAGAKNSKGSETITFVPVASSKPIYFNDTQINKIYFNGTEVTGDVYFNGTKIT